MKNKNVLFLLSYLYSINTIYSSFSLEEEKKEINIATSMTTTAELIKFLRVDRDSPDYTNETHHRKIENQNQTTKDIFITKCQDFITSLESPCFKVQKKTLQTLQEFNLLEENFLYLTLLFWTESAKEREKIPSNLLSNSSVGKNSPQQKAKILPYVLLIQRLTAQFLEIRERIKNIPQPKEFEIIESKAEQEYKVGIISDDRGFIPFAIKKWGLTASKLHYGDFSYQPHTFIFSEGKLIKEVGIYINNFPSSLEFLLYNPYSKMSDQTPGYYALPKNNYLAKILSPLFKESPTFLPLPSTEREQELLELLFLEDLTQEKTFRDQKNSILFSLLSQNEIDTPPTLEQIKTELENHLLQKYEQEIEITETNLQKEEKSIKDPSPAENGFIQDLLGVRKKEKVKTHGKAYKSNKAKESKYPKAQDKKGKGKATESPLVTSEEIMQKKKQKAHLLFSKVKQEARVKNKEMLKLLNSIYQEFPTEVLQEKFKSVVTRGSHRTLHLMTGGGIGWVQKHGREDLTISPKVANKITLKLINLLLGIITNP